MGVDDPGTRGYLCALLGPQPPGCRSCVFQEQTRIASEEDANPGCLVCDVGVAIIDGA